MIEKEPNATSEPTTETRTFFVNDKGKKCEFVPFPLPEPTPDMSEAEGFFLQHVWLEMYFAAIELHPDYRKNEHGMWQGATAHRRAAPTRRDLRSRSHTC
jgi:hypothetical protein